MTEKQWQAQVLDLAQLLGWLHYHTFFSLRSQYGFPDLVLVRDRVIFAELKKQTGRLSLHQKVWRESLQAAGAEVYVWRPADFDAVRDVLTRRAA